MYNLNFDIWKFGHPQCANSANGAMSILDVSNNKLTRGKAKYGSASDPNDASDWEIDMTGVVAFAEALKK